MQFALLVATGSDIVTASRSWCLFSWLFRNALAENDLGWLWSFRIDPWPPQKDSGSDSVGLGWLRGDSVLIGAVTAPNTSSWLVVYVIHWRIINSQPLINTLITLCISKLIVAAPLDHWLWTLVVLGEVLLLQIPSLTLYCCGKLSG